MGGSKNNFFIPYYKKNGGLPFFLARYRLGRICVFAQSVLLLFRGYPRSLRSLGMTVANAIMIIDEGGLPEYRHRTPSITV